MPLEAPNLDDRRFEDIVREAQALIPRYLPEWTDWNQSDPGITLIQLFAWMHEMLIYRVNKVPELHYIKFLQMLGIERRSPMPARADLTFTLTPGELSSVTVPRGTQIAAASEGEGEPVIFETDEALIALGATLKAVQTFENAGFAVQTEANAVTGEHYPAFGFTASKDSALYLGFDSSQPFPTEEINLTIYLFNPVEPKAHACDLEEIQIVPPAEVVWEHWDGAQWSSLNIIRDDTRFFTRSGHVFFRGPSKFPKRQLGSEEVSLYWIRARVKREGYETPPELDEVLTNTVQATAATTIEDEIIGSSDGLPGQTFNVGNKPIFSEPPRMEQIRERKRHKAVDSSSEDAQAEQENIREQEQRKGFLLEVDEGSGFLPWEEVEDFFESDSDDHHYVLNHATGDVQFGNGERGKIPLAGINNIAVRFYRYGGGANGNVGAESITAIQTAVSFVQGVTNKRAAEGGTDEESVDDTKLRGPREIKSRNRAVTPEDFEFLAVQTPGARIRRAHAIPLHHPQFPGVDVPGAVTVVVIPDSKDPKPIPSEGTLRTICAHLNRHRLLTTEVFVVPPKYKEIRIEARIIAGMESDLAEIGEQIEKRLLEYFHPLTGGADKQGWKPGADVYYSEIFREILQVEGIRRIEEMHVVVDGERLGIAEDADIPDGFLLFSQTHQIQVSYERGT